MPFSLLLVETKALSEMGKIEESQLINYLRTCECEVGLLINFGPEQIVVDRKLHTNDRKPWLHRPAARSAAEAAKRPEISRVRKNRGGGASPGDQEDGRAPLNAGEE